MIVILDLDYTILDTTAFKKGLIACLESLGVTPEQFYETYGTVAHAIPGQHGYSFERQAALLHERYGYDAQEVLRRLTDTYQILPDYLYPDTVPFLQLLKERGIYTALFTWANPDHQEAKLKHLNIAEYLSKVIVTSEAKGTAELDLPAPVSEWVFINDNPNEIRALAARYPESKTVRIKRHDGKQFPPEEDMLDVPTFTSLDEVRTYLGLSAR